MISSVSEQEIARISRFEEHNPSEILGPKLVKRDGRAILSIRAYLPRALRAWIYFPNLAKKIEMAQIYGTNFYEAQFEDELANSPEKNRYVISSEDSAGYVQENEDAYAFSPIMSDFDIYLFSEGTHRRSYEKMGAHQIELDGVKGAHFAVWAPNARSVCLIGNFNHWTVGENPMISRGSSGIWELFVPRIKVSEVYKFAIKSNVDRRILEKTDPYAFETEIRPRTAAIVADLSEYEWQDGEWMLRRSNESSLVKPISVYEVHLGSWRRKKNDGAKNSEDRFLSYREIADELVPYVKKMGFTHVELLPVMEHPLDDSWGYQVVNYYAPTSRFGKSSDLMFLIDQCHQHGIGVILDWVPAHFPKDEYGLALFDGTHLFNHADKRLGEFLEWGTYAFNYSRNEVRSFLISNANFWFQRYHADGLRIDAVASMLYLDYARKPGEWLPNKFGGRENLDAVSFLKELNSVVHSEQRNVLMIAEESTAWPGVTHPVESGGLGFDMKWNMGWMHDTLDYFTTDSIFRKYHHNNLTFSLIYAFSERFILVFSHDEVVYGKRSMLNKMSGDVWQKFANLRLCYGYLYTHPGKKLLFMGSEFGQWNEWNFRSSLDWDLLQNPLNSELELFVKDLNRLYNSKKELHEQDFSHEGFEWIDFHDTEQSVISFMRKAQTEEHFVVVVCNMTPVPRYNYRIGVPSSGYYQEILNSDAREYGGSGVGNLGGVDSEPVSVHGKSHSIKVTLPPLGVLVLEHAHQDTK